MDPNVIDLIDAEKAVKVIAEIYGFPQEIIRPLARVQQIRQQRAEAQQEQAEMQKEMQEAEMMVKAAPVLQKAAQEEGV
jgi:reverse gyrase